MRLSRSFAVVMATCRSSGHVTVSINWLTESNIWKHDGRAQPGEPPPSDPAQQASLRCRALGTMPAERIIERPAQDQALLRGGEKECSQRRGETSLAGEDG